MQVLTGLILYSCIDVMIRGPCQGQNVDKDIFVKITIYMMIDDASLFLEWLIYVMFLRL